MKATLIQTLATIVMPILGCLLSIHTNAQASDSTKITIANIVTIHSKILNQDRKLYIYTPALSTMEKFAGKTLPVLYLMDGDVLTSLVAPQVNYLSTGYSQLPPMIIVGMNNYSYDRMADLTPSHATTRFDGKPDTAKNSPLKTTGGGTKFLQFVKEEVIPYVEGHYKTEPFRIFAGHSLGGLMSYYCLANDPNLFNAYIAVSPSLWWDKEFELKQADKKLSAITFKNKFFFFSDGNEGGNFHKDVVALDSILKRKNIAGLKYKYIYYPDETHGSEPIKALYDGLRFIYPQWYHTPKDTTATLVKKHYDQLSADYGYSIVPWEDAINRLGKRMMANPKKIEAAIDIYRLNTVYYPSSYKAYDFIGDAYLKKGDKAKAIASFQKALALAPEREEIKVKLVSAQKK